LVPAASSTSWVSFPSRLKNLYLTIDKGNIDTPFGNFRSLWQRSSYFDRRKALVMYLAVMTDLYELDLTYSASFWCGTGRFTFQNLSYRTALYSGVDAAREE